MTLIGRYFVETGLDHSSYRVGRIREEVSQGFYLVDFEVPDGMPPDVLVMPMEVVGIADMSARCLGCGERTWDFFETEGGRDLWLEAANRAGDEAEEEAAASGDTPPKPATKVSAIEFKKKLH